MEAAESPIENIKLLSVPTDRGIVSSPNFAADPCGDLLDGDRGSTPKEVVDQIKAAEKLGVHCLPTGYHGKMSDKVRKEHFRDPNKAMEPYDLVATSTVMAVGTDLDLKFSHAFFETRRGHTMSELPSNQTVAQLTGRPGRSLERPLSQRLRRARQRPCKPAALGTRATARLRIRAVRG